MEFYVVIDCGDHREHAYTSLNMNTQNGIEEFRKEKRLKYPYRFEIVWWYKLN